MCDARDDLVRKAAEEKVPVGGVISGSIALKRGARGSDDYQ